MKFAAALSLAVAPLALAKSVHNIYPVRRTNEIQKNNGNQRANTNNNNNNNNNNKNNGGIIEAQSTEIIIIWANQGGGAATSTINNVVTVTQTVTAGAVATTVGTATVAAGATTVVAGTGATHSVIVGGAAGLVYSPASVQAAVGDMVVFTFESNNHTATQSAFTTPCDPLAGGMDSGFQANVNNSVNPPPQVAMQVMVSTPLWFYCKQANHCGEGMTFSINPTANKTQAMFQAMAIAQKGTGSGSAITGNATTSTGTTGSTGSTGSSASSAAGAGTGTSSSGSSVVSGVGTLASGQCVCAVSCAAGSFPAVQAQGLSAFGGFAGSLPVGSMEVV